MKLMLRNAFGMQYHVSWSPINYNISGLGKKKKKKSIYIKNSLTLSIIT